MKLSPLQRAFLYISCLPMLLYFPKAAGAQAQPTTYAITHAKIFTLSGAAIDDGTVVIQNGKIANVGAAVVWRVLSTVTAVSADMRWFAGRRVHCGGGCGWWQRWCRWPLA